MGSALYFTLLVELQAGGDDQVEDERKRGAVLRQVRASDFVEEITMGLFSIAA